MKFINFNNCKKLVKPVLKWIHLSAILGILLLLNDHILEALILLVLMYEIGFEISAIDALMSYNNILRKWILRQFSPRRKKHG